MKKKEPVNIDVRKEALKMLKTSKGFALVVFNEDGSNNLAAQATGPEITYAAFLLQTDLYEKYHRD